jgi:polysaccharide biosynthesis protein PslH
VVHVARGLLRTGSGSAARFWDPELAAHVRAATAESPTDLLQVEYSQLAPYLRTGTARTAVLDFHNIESSLARSYARGSNGARARLAWAEAIILRRLERRATAWCDVVVVVSDQDRNRLPGRPRELLVCPNGWDPRMPLAPTSEPNVAFVALMGWKPNVDAAVWFTREVWPLIRREAGNARLLLVGREPAPAVRALSDDSVTVTGTVPDVREYLARSMVALAPLLSGGGTRLKVLEALDAGRPVVATSIGIDGLTDLVGLGVLVADEPKQFARHVTNLLTDPAESARLGRTGNEAVRDRYAWDRVLEPWVRRITRR